MEISVAGQNNDIIMKLAAEMFRDVSLEFFGLKVPKITGVVPTHLPTLEVKESDMDFVFLLEDESYLHMEFQTTRTRNDIIRFLLYDARLYERDRREIRTIVIYSGGIESAREDLEIGSIHYHVDNVYMKHYNGDEAYLKLSEKIHSQERLGKADQLRLIFLALMKAKETEEEMAMKAVELAKQMKEREQRIFTLASILAVSDKFLSQRYKKKIMEVLEMTDIERMIREKGWAEGKLEEKRETIIKLLKIRFTEDFPIFMIERIMEIDNMEYLDDIFEGIARSESIRDVEKLLN